MRRMARGEGKAGCIFWALVVLVVGLAAYKIVPAKIAVMQLEDRMEELAKHQQAAMKPTDWYEKNILRRAQQLDLPVKAEDIEVDKTGKRVVMDVKITIVIDFIVTQYPMSFDIHMDRDLFLV